MSLPRSLMPHKVTNNCFPFSRNPCMKGTSEYTRQAKSIRRALQNSVVLHTKLSNLPFATSGDSRRNRRARNLSDPLRRVINKQYSAFKIVTILVCENFIVQRSPKVTSMSRCRTVRFLAHGRREDFPLKIR
jgi:hypothetical protein